MLTNSGLFGIICIYGIYRLYRIDCLYRLYGIVSICLIGRIYGMKGIDRMSTKKSLIIKVEEEQYKQWREEALKYFQAYNFSQFVRDAIEEKLAGVRDVRDTPSPQDSNDFDW